MKFFSRTTLGAVIITVLFVLPTCTKLRVYVEDHPSAISKICRIDSLIINPYDAVINHFHFSYDAAGNPVEFEQDGPNNVDGLDLHFRYDKKGRLSDVQLTGPGLPSVFIWDRYSYPNSWTIIDSTYTYQGSINDLNPPNPPGTFVRIEKMELDEAGRPIKFLDYSSNPNSVPNSFGASYDRNGNLVIPGVTYDDKLNIYQTSNVWQLIYRDFSRNNPTAPPPGTHTGLPTTPAAYNSYGLPTKFLGPFQTFFGFSFDKMDVVYSCDSGY